MTFFTRPTSPALDEILGQKFPVLDHGFVRVVDYMGNDGAIVQAARVSYGGGTKTPQEDANLIRYLMRHRHSSPFEMCVDGDTRVQTFPCPGAAVKHYTMRELAAAFEAGSAGSWARLTYIRTVNPNTGMVERTRIKRVWKTGVKPCFRVTVGALSRQIIVTDNHPFLCPDGEYRTLADLSVGSEVALNGRPATPTDIREHVISMRSAGKKLDEISRALGIAPSTVCKLARQAGLRVRAERKTGFLKKDIGDHADPRSIARRRVPHGPCMLCGATGRDIHHIDENPHNNDASNLLRLCAKHHRHIHTYGVLKKAVPGAITAIEPVGEREVFDLEVASDNHNFVADGFVVHNCEIKLHVKLPIFVARQWIRHRTANVNEVSGRYSVLPEEFYVPEEKNILPQSKTNKQGRGDTTSPREQRPTEDIQWHMIKANKDSFECYNSVLGAGIARELARVVLPLATYTEWYWKIDLHNLFHFLKLRMDSHAQWEIRQYAEEIFKLVKLWVPVAAQAWLDYQYNSVTLSAAQIKLIAAKLAGEPSEPSTFKLSIREVQELEEALKRDE